MARKSKDAEEFNALKELGFGFQNGGTPNEFNVQSGSGGAPKGKVARQECGTDDDEMSEGLESDEMLDAIIDADGLEIANELLPGTLSIGEPTHLNGEFAAISQYTATHAQDEQEIIEDDEKYFQDPKITHKILNQPIVSNLQIKNVNTTASTAGRKGSPRAASTK